MQIQQLNSLKTVSKSAICPRRSPWLRIVLVRSLRSARLHTAWLVKRVTYFDLIGLIGGCVREFQRSKYKFSSHPKALELTGKYGVTLVTGEFLSQRASNTENVSIWWHHNGWAYGSKCFNEGNIILFDHYFCNDIRMYKLRLCMEKWRGRRRQGSCRTTNKM